MSTPLENKHLLLEYARHHGITRPCRMEDIAIESEVPDRHDIELGPFEAEELIATDLLSYSPIRQEKLTLSREEGYFLASSLKLVENALKYDDIENGYCRRLKRLKLELPLLRTDNDLDVCAFVRRRQRSPSLEHAYHEITQAGERLREGISWSAYAIDLPEKFEKLSRSEKLEVGWESAAFLQHALAPKPNENHSEEVHELGFEMAERRRPVKDRITPPLSPITECNSNQDSSPQPLLRDLLSEHTSPTVHAGKNLERSLAEQDALNTECREITSPSKTTLHHTATDELADLYRPLRPFFDNPISSSPKRPRAADLKMDENLTPPATIQQRRSVSYSDELTQYARPLATAQSRSSSDCQDEFDALFHEVINLEACHVARNIEHELLQEEDTTMRVDVPELDFSIPDPPWVNQLPARKEEEIRELMLPVALMKLHHLPKTRNERDLRWVPFPTNIDKSVIDEAIHQSELVENLTELTLLGPSTDPEVLSWKPAGLRILDMHDNESDDIEVGEYNNGPGLGQSVRKRKAGIEGSYESFDDSANAQSISNVHDTGLQQLSCRTVRTDDFNYPKLPSRNTPKPDLMTSTLHFGDAFSAADEIDRFVDLQAGRISKKQKTNGEIEETRPPLDAYGTQSSKRDSDSSGRKSRTLDVQSSTSDKGAKLASLLSGEGMPIPGSSGSPAPSLRPIIVSSTILSQQRQLVKAILTIQPSLQLISREFHPWQAIQTDGQQRSQKSQPMLDQEADILISPGTGIILTTMQKIKQKPLPRQGELSAIRSRILSICPRYEHLFVIVCPDAAPAASITNVLQSKLLPVQLHTISPNPAGTETSSSSSIPIRLLQTEDAEAIASLTSWTARLTSVASITVNFIPATGEEPWPTARWISGLVNTHPLPETLSKTRAHETTQGPSTIYDNNSEHATQEGAMPLIQDETTWELLLRKAGMNAFGAQAVLLALREPTAADDGSSTVVGAEAACRSRNGPEQGVKQLCGLSAFALMTVPERRARLSELMGGSRVLDRVGRLFDRRWGSKGTKP